MQPLPPKHLLELSDATVIACLNALQEMPLKVALLAFNELVAAREAAIQPQRNGSGDDV